MGPAAASSLLSYGPVGDRESAASPVAVIVTGVGPSISGAGLCTMLPSAEKSVGKGGKDQRPTGVSSPDAALREAGSVVPATVSNKLFVVLPTV